VAEPMSNEPLCTIRSWPDGRGATMQLRARYLNYDVADELKAVLRTRTQELQDSGRRHFVLELAEVSIVDSCGVGLMIGLHNQIHAAGGSLWLVGVTQFLQKILRMMHLDQYFQVAASEADVLARLATTAA
jgi:anti-anti-sigma factor